MKNLAQQLTEQHKEEDNEEDHGTTEMQMEYLTDILSAIQMAVEKLCVIDPDWEHSSTVQRAITAMLHTYYEILQKRRKNQNS
jgi:exosome complex RNA-binding protein Rrp42 (RNase PH superfamily)